MKGIDYHTDREQYCPGCQAFLADWAFLYQECPCGWKGGLDGPGDEGPVPTLRNLSLEKHFNTKSDEGS
jgi:hypothetical protein